MFWERDALWNLLSCRRHYICYIEPNQTVICVYRQFTFVCYSTNLVATAQVWLSGE